MSNSERQAVAENTESVVLPRLALAQKTLASADIAARLNSAQKDASRLSLSAKNLAVLAMRMGIAGVGLKTLSGFYDELAKASIKISLEINGQAGVIAKNSVSLWRKFMFSDNLQRVQHSMGAAQDELIEQKLKVAHGHIKNLTEQSQIESRRLTFAIDELDQQMRSMQVIVVNARIEASAVPEYQEQLAELTAQIQRATSAILAEVRSCRQWLKDLE